MQKYYVAPGKYYVGSTTPQILKASLGTCVGVALYDEIPRVGGIIHLLLNKPPTEAGKTQPEKYATTGLPIFLDALLNAGASLKNLKAWVAGGALVGPLEKYDIEFNIGAQTTETVVTFLASKNIDIQQSETGGFFTCVLSLNLQSFECTIEPVGFEKKTSISSMSNCTEDEIIRSIENLQPIPQVALKILQLINEDNYDISMLTTEMREDQTLSARTIRLCNSSYFGKRNTIESIDHALVYLGQKLLIKFVISAAIIEFFKQTSMGYSLCKGGLYHHAVGTAAIAEIIAKVTGGVDPALAYTGGLLHDIGKVVLDQYIQAASPLFYRQVYEEGINSLAAEKSLLGIDHTSAGSILAKQWSFPESLHETVKHHHRPEETSQYTELVHIIYLADLLMSRFYVGLEVERLDTDCLADKFDAIGLSINTLPDIVDMIPEEVFIFSLDTIMDNV